MLKGAATGITIGGVPCGQLSLPIGYAQIIDSETNDVTTLAGSYYVNNGKRYFVEPYFSREDDTEPVHGDGTFENENEGIDAPPLNTLIIIGYAEESLLASIQAAPLAIHIRLGMI